MLLRISLAVHELGWCIVGSAAPIVRQMKCSTFHNAISIIVDTPMRNVCDDFWKMQKILVTPYVPNPLEAKNPRAYLHLPYRPLADRITLVRLFSDSHLSLFTTEMHCDSDLLLSTSL